MLTCAPRRWITNGTFADYFTVACQTPEGYAVILVERQDAVSTKAIKTAYSPAAGTAYVTFERARAPTAHTLGAPNEAFGAAILVGSVAGLVGRFSIGVVVDW